METSILYWGNVRVIYSENRARCDCCRQVSKTLKVSGLRIATIQGK